MAMTKASGGAAATKAAARGGASATTTTRAAPATAAAALGADDGKPAKTKAATEFNPSGAPQQVVPDVDANHPAVDANPREGTTEVQNRIDFNDPTKTGAEAVADNLKKQG